MNSDFKVHGLFLNNYIALICFSSLHNHRSKTFEVLTLAVSYESKATFDLLFDRTIVTVGGNIFLLPTCCLTIVFTRRLPT